MQFLVFFLIVLVIYFFANYYVFYRGLQALSNQNNIIIELYKWSFWIIASTYIIGRFAERIQISFFSDVLVWIGSFWLGALLYLFLFVLLLDVFRLINHFFPFFPDFLFYSRTKIIGFIFVVTAVFGLLLGGFINARNPKVRFEEIHIDKYANGLKSLNVVLLSDIHLGTIIGNRHLGKVVQEVNSLEPDIIFLAGDALDEDIEPVIRQNLTENLLMLKSELGTYAVMGNHEHIGGAEKAYEYLSSHGIIIIRDSIVKIKNSFYIIGREDYSSSNFEGKKRKSLDELFIGIEDTELPLLLMDHQPVELQNAADIGIDIQLSGHTHKGQLWPLNYIIDAAYKIGYGYDMIDNMHVYVSSGIGTWGPPVRIGSRPEIVNIRVTFSDKK